jgi:hypothetical protein
MRAAGIRHSAASVSPNVPGKEELEYGNNIPKHREIQQARTERKLTQKELSRGADYVTNENNNAHVYRTALVTSNKIFTNIITHVR